MATVPTFDDSGQLTGLVVPIPICAAVHAVRPCAADGFSVMPSGSVTWASRMSAVLVEVANCGTRTSVVAPSGESIVDVSALSCAVGSNGTFSHPSTPTGVCVSACLTSPSYDSTSRYEVVDDEHSLGSVRKFPAPARPLKISFDFRIGTDFEMFLISKYSW